MFQCETACDIAPAAQKILCHLKDPSTGDTLISHVSGDMYGRFTNEVTAVLRGLKSPGDVDMNGKVELNKACKEFLFATADEGKLFCF